jgi:hypothetical protein
MISDLLKLFVIRNPMSEAIRSFEEAHARVRKAVALLNGYIAYLHRAASTKLPLEGGPSATTSNQ